jgi:hypothetical protein
MRSLLVFAFVIQSVPARAQPIVSLFGGASKLIASSQDADLGFTGGAAVGWRFTHVQPAREGPGLRMASALEIAVAYTHWGRRYDDVYAFTVAPGIRAGVVKGAWTPGIAFHFGYVRGSEALLESPVYAGGGCGVPTAPRQGVVFDFGPGVDLALGRRWVLRGEAVFHLGVSGDGAAGWMTFGPSLGITL